MNTINEKVQANALAFWLVFWNFEIAFFPIASSWSYHIHFFGAGHLLGYFALPHSHLLVLVRGSYIVGSVVDNVKALFFRQLWSHDLGLTRILVTLLRSWIRRFAIIISLLGGFEQAENLVDKNLKKFTGTLDLWKLLSRCSNLQTPKQSLQWKVRELSHRPI